MVECVNGYVGEWLQNYGDSLDKIMSFTFINKIA